MTDTHIRPGRVTIPSEAGFAAETDEIATLWGADAVRNSDGTKLDAEVLALGKKVYTAYFPVRSDNEFISQRMTQVPQFYLMSERTLAETDGPLGIELMRRYFDQQLVVNADDDPKRYWEVIDRTTGAVVDPGNWRYEPTSGQVVIGPAEAFHEYTVSFLAYIIWDPVQMYNHLTNGWGDKEHEIPYDIVHPEVWDYVRGTFERWLKDNPEVDVVRFTTFFYQFSLLFDEQGREKFVDWFGYGATVSARMLQSFEQARGYALRPEDFVDEGYYNSSFRIPSARYLDYLDFVSGFVAEHARELVEMAHEAGKEAMMFLGDQWIGMEPYGERFASIGLDAVVGSVGDGTTLRMISDIDVGYTEGRFLPYFFPDTFYEGNDPSTEARQNWLQARRAILRSPVQRMGYGGYLSLAAKFPKFIDTVADITEEFRELHEHIGTQKPYSGLKVAVLNHWGKLRSWQAFTVAHALYSKQAYSYYGVLEALSGMAVDVEFISFADVIEHGVEASIDVIITAGVAETAFSGGGVWQDPRLVTALRGWVRDGGGLIGVGEPSASLFQGRYFQLADCFGVDREMSQSLSTDKYHRDVTEEHFITADTEAAIDFGEPLTNVYSLGAETQILDLLDDDVRLAAHQAGRGRAVYLAGLPYSTANARLLLRALHWAASAEEKFPAWLSSNPACEVNYFPETGYYSVANSTDEAAETVVTTGDGTSVPLRLNPNELLWRKP